MPKVLYTATHPVQYLSPLLDHLQASTEVDLHVLYGNDAGTRDTYDAGFGRATKWDIPLTARHEHTFVSRGPRSIGSVKAREVPRLARLVRQADIVIVNGYATPFAALVIVSCLTTRTPYLLRSDSTGLTARSRLDPRRLWADLVSRRARGALSSGTRNSDVHRARGTRRLYPVPFTVDVTRYAAAAERWSGRREELRSLLGLPPQARLVLFAGKLQPHKRPSDLVAALDRLPSDVHVVFVGDGPLRAELEASADSERATFLGFVNQSSMPETLAAADLLVLPSSYEPWGLVVNEGLACGLVPVVSDAVGCAPDLVSGVGEIFPVGDVPALAAAVSRALERLDDPGQRRRFDQFLEDYSIAQAASALESAVLAATD